MKLSKSKKEKKLSKKTLSVKIEFTISELEHLRDLFSITVQPSSNTVSELLAVVEKREDVEKQLWAKIFEACENNVKTDKDAPDFVLGVADVPPLGVFRIEKE